MAGKISSTTIEQVNERTDIISLIGEYTRLEKRGDDWWGCCPFHNEKTASFHVVPDRHMYHCFGCGQGGGVINFYMEVEKVSFVEAVKNLAKRSGVEIIYDGSEFQQESPNENNSKDIIIDLYTRVAGSFHYILTSDEKGKVALSYLHERGLSDDTIRKFQLGFAPNDRRWLKRFLLSKNYSEEFLETTGLFSKKYKDVSFFSNRIMFPISSRDGKVIAFGGRILEGDGPKYMNSGEMVQYKKGETLYAFNLARKYIRETKTVIFCEGYMDVIAYHQCGLKNAVAPLGTALTEDQVKIIRSFVDTVLLSFDSDGAGIKATYKAILLCRKAGLTVKIIVLAQGKDPAEIMNTFGSDILTRDVDSAIMDSDYLLSMFSKEFNTETPEGKTQAALAFFPYVDALTSDIQKESCLDLLCQNFNLKPEAVKKDYNNRDDARKRLQYKNKNTDEQNNVKNVEKIKLNAELRSILAVIANIEFFPLMRTWLTSDDFEDSLARNIFIALEECYRDDAFSYDSIMLRCGDSECVKNMIAQAVTSGEFASNSERTIKDSIQLIRRNSLERKRDRIMNRIRQLRVVTLEDEKQMEMLLSEKVNIDQELNRKKDADE